MLKQFVYILLLGLITYVPVILGIAFIILAERKVLAAVQRREGPNVVGLFGLLQSIIDGLKLVLKENILPHKSNKYIFILSAFTILTLSLLGWLVVPTSLESVLLDLDYSIFFIFFLSIFNVYCVIFAGWASNSKYALLGALRSASQMISYEVYLGLLLVPIFMFSESLNFTDIVLVQRSNWFVFMFFPLFVIFTITGLAETNRTPFYLPEAEAEIVAGYNVEYSGLIFSLFFLAEYNNIFLMSSFNVIFFWGGWLFFGFDNEITFFIKTMLISVLFVFLRGILPRYRYDQLMMLGWKKFLPIILSLIFFYTAVFVVIQWLVFCN